MDKITPEQRSVTMSRVRSKNTAPELRVRAWLHAHGYRYSLHSRKLPGKPDIVLRKYKTVIEVRGCFWHRHPGCPVATMPESNAEYWWRKFNANVARDIDTEKRLRELGWKVIVVWECCTEPEGRLVETMREVERILQESLPSKSGLRYDHILIDEDVPLVADPPED